MKKQCPLVASYCFTSRCKITSCKNYTPTTANRCLALDVKAAAGDTPISDSELLLYKFPDKEITVKDVKRIRSKATDRMNSWIMFHHVVAHILNTEKPEQFIYQAGRSQLVDSVIADKPLNVQDFNFMPWMLLKLVDEKYCTTIVPQFSFRSVLNLSQREYDAFSKDVRVMASGDTLFQTIV